MLFIAAIMAARINSKAVSEEWSDEFLSSWKKKNHFTTKFKDGDLIRTIYFIPIDLKSEYIRRITRFIVRSRYVKRSKTIRNKLSAN